jgi:prepilin-type N-terminal cleavage/methylation domain-containing protein
MPLTPASGDRARSRRGEQGYTLIEMLVVILIIAIILAMLISTFRGTKKTTFSKTAQATAFAYQQAIDAYMADNGQRAPVVGQTEWPVQDRGPVDPMFSSKPYMKSTPEHVSGGMVDFKTPNQQIDYNAEAVVNYIIDPSNPGLYTLEVWVLQGSDGSKQLDCIVTNRGQLKPGERKCVS